MIKTDLLNGIQKALCIKEKLGNLTLKIKTFTHKNVIQLGKVRPQMG